MTDPNESLKELAEAVSTYEEADAARTAAHTAVIARALDALRAGIRPGIVYDAVPFTSTHIRTLAREAGVPKGPSGKVARKKAAAQPDA